MASTPQPSQIWKRQNNYPIRYVAPSSPIQKEDKAERQKRQAHLAQNRRAATKCREKKRTFTRQLESQYDQVSRRKQSLESDFAQLQKEILELKNQLLRHSQCPDPALQAHLAGMTRNLAVANSPSLACSYPTTVLVSENSVSSSLPPSIDEDSSTMHVSGCEADETRPGLVLTVNTDAGPGSLVYDQLFEDFLDLD